MLPIENRKLILYRILYTKFSLNKESSQTTVLTLIFQFYQRTLSFPDCEFLVVCVYMYITQVLKLKIFSLISIKFCKNDLSLS